MEGFRGLPPAPLTPFYWSPGWNSVQSVNKYQEEVGGPLRGGDPGIRLFEPIQHGKTNYFTSVPEVFVPVPDRLLMVPLHHIFGSEELSARSPAVAQRSSKPYVAVSSEDAAQLKVQDGQLLAFEVEGQAYRLPVKISSSLAKGVAGLPYGLPGLPFVELPAWATPKKE
jgi:NADH-quinone oxidoreductase subunit G